MKEIIEKVSPVLMIVMVCLSVLFGGGVGYAATTFMTLENGAASTLDGGINSTTTTIVVANGDVFPSTYPFHISISGLEIVECTNRAGDTMTVIREEEGTTGVPHDDGATVRLGVTKEYITELQDAINTLEALVNPGPLALTGVLSVATTVNEANKISRNQTTTSAPLLELESTHISDDQAVLLIDQKATGVIDGLAITTDATGAGLHITGTAAAGVALDVDVAASQTGRAAYFDLGTWLGTSGQGAMELTSDSAGHIPAGQMLRINQQGTGQHAAAIGGSSLYIADAATAPAAGTSYAVKIDATNIEALHVDTGNVLIDETLTASTLKIGTTGTDNLLQINTGAATGGIEVDYDDSDSSATVYYKLLLDSSDDLTIDASGNTVSLGSNDSFNAGMYCNVGFDGATVGIFSIYGNSENGGGRARIFNGDNEDTNANHYDLYVNGDYMDVGYLGELAVSVEQGLRIYYTGNVLPRTYIQTFTQGDATPDISTGAVWRVYGVGGLTITDFDSPYGAQELTVLGSYNNEQQTVTVTNGNDTDSFTLTYSGQTTASLDWDCTTGEMVTALEALSNIGDGDVAISEAGGVYTVIFQDDMAETDIAEMTSTPTDCNVAHATTIVGGTDNTTIVQDGTTIELEDDWLANGENQLCLVYDTFDDIWREISRKTSDSIRYYHMAANNHNPGASGGAWVDPNANNGGGWRITADAHTLNLGADVHADWDGVSDLVVEVHFSVGAAGNADDTIDLLLTSYYKANGDTASKTQSETVATVTDGVQHTDYIATFTINYDEVDNVVETGDEYYAILNLVTATSEIDNAIIGNVTFYYLTKHHSIRLGDT